MDGSSVIAYLTSAYARATDTFIRDEVSWLRAGRGQVVTFSIRKPAATEVVNDVDRGRAGADDLPARPAAEQLRGRHPAVAPAGAASPVPRGRVAGP